MARTQAKQCDRCGFLAPGTDKTFVQLSLRKLNDRDNWERAEAWDLCPPCAERLQTTWLRPGAQTAFGDPAFVPSNDVMSGADNEATARARAAHEEAFDPPELPDEIAP